MTPGPPDPGPPWPILAPSDWPTPSTGLRPPSCDCFGGGLKFWPRPASSVEL